MFYKIKYINLQAQHNSIKNEIKKKIENIFSRSAFILRQEVLDFEKKITKLLKVKYCIALNSGTDALLMSLSQLKIEKGEEIIVPSHTYVASVGTIKHIGAEPVFVDIRDDFNLDPNDIIKKITKKTRAIMVVHLNGRCCEMDKIMNIAKKYKLQVIEDCAQAFGSKFNNKNAGSFGLSGAFSLHPMKNLNVPGDGGFLITNNKKVYTNVLLLRDHGRLKKKNREIRKSYGLNSRLDNLHAGIALIKLKYFKKWVAKRRSIAKEYCLNLSNLRSYVKLPIYENNSKFYETFNSFVLRVKNRNNLKKFLLKNKIEVFSHIDKGVHLEKHLTKKKIELKNTEKIEKEIISLPIYPELKKKDIIFVCKTIRKFYED
jgi:dTDP-4-amino-4,6-dideoxygalactose transaminase